MEYINLFSAMFCGFIGLYFYNEEIIDIIIIILAFVNLALFIKYED